MFTKILILDKQAQGQNKVKKRRYFRYRFRECVFSFY